VCDIERICENLLIFNAVMTKTLLFGSFDHPIYALIDHKLYSCIRCLSDAMLLYDKRFDYYN